MKSSEFNVKNEDRVRMGNGSCAFRPSSKFCAPHSSLFTSSSGFSLVEVMLAIGIVSFAVVGVLTAFPIGIEAARDSRDEITAALIADDLFTRMRSQPWTTTANGTSGGLRLPRIGGFWTIHPGTVWSWSSNTALDNLYCYARDGQIANAASGGTWGDRPKAGDPYRSDEGYFAVRFGVLGNPYRDIPTERTGSTVIPGLGNILPISGLATNLSAVIVEVSWPARQPYYNRKFRRQFDSNIANLH